MSDEKDLAALQKQLKVSFANLNLLRQVFVHRSYLNEHPGFDLEHNERLEFLGDAVLELVVTRLLFDTYPLPEGILTSYRSALVKGEHLSTIASKLHFADYLFLSRGEQRSDGKAKQLILANTFEAFIGALYLDQGYEAAAAFIKRVVWPAIKKIVTDQLYLDSKSRLQELSQDKFNVTPSYRVLSETGPDHNKLFTVGAYIGTTKVAEGTGASKQTAQTAAAETALADWPSIEQNLK